MIWKNEMHVIWFISLVIFGMVLVASVAGG